MFYHFGLNFHLALFSGGRSRANIPLENYLIRCIYEMVIFLYEGEGQVDKNIHMVPHHETRGCLFDMNVFIDRVVYSCDKPTICDECKTRLRKLPLPDGFTENITKELARIRKPLYFQIEERVKTNPIISLLLASVFAIVLNVIASFIYEWLKR